MANLSKSESFTNIFKKYFPSFCVYTLSFVKDEEVAKDIVSDVFALLWSKKEELDFDSELIIAYIKTSVRNRSLNYLVNLKTKNRYEESIATKSGWESNTIEDIYTTSELYEILQKSLNKLPDNYKSIFIKRYLEGKKNIEIAADLNLSTKSIERYNKKILDFLRKELKDYEFLLLILLLA